MKKCAAVSTPRILIVEDDSATMRSLKDFFNQAKYTVHTAMDGELALEAALEATVDIILLDAMLPKVSGFDVCARLREANIDTPIIMLTSRGEEKDIVRGLNIGADDYVTKPFSLVQLQARCAAFIRRNKQQALGVCRFGPFTLNLDSHKLTDDDDNEIPLAPKEYALLQFFLKKAGYALTRETLLKAVWRNQLLVTERSVDRCVNTLRQKIEIDTRRPKYVQSIRDIGYRFVNS